MSSYGFVHLPSLLVFLRPQPSTFWRAARDAVDSLTVSRGDFDEVAGRLTNVDDDQRQEAVLRVTALSHELRHFHDFLLTPYGNRLVRDAFWYSLLTYGALTEVSQAQRGTQRLEVALPVDPSSLPVYGRRLQTMRSTFHERARRGLSLLEANAMHTQIQQAEIDLGSAAAEALSGALRRMGGQYSETLTHLWRMQDALEIADSDFAPVALSLTLYCLLDADAMPIEEVTVPVAESARGLVGPAAAQLMLSATMEVIDSVVGRAMTASQQENEKFLEILDSDAVPEPLRELVREAFADFARAALAVQRRFLSDPMLLLDPGRYLREGVDLLVFPFVYLLSDGGTTMQVEHRSWEAYLSDPLAHVREYSVEKQTVYELVCVPTRAPTHALNEDAWKTFADTVAGSLVIAEGANRENPVEGMWMRKIEERWPIKFTPFGDQGAWQAAPGGSIV